MSWASARIKISEQVHLVDEPYNSEFVDPKLYPSWANEKTQVSGLCTVKCFSAKHTALGALDTRRCVHVAHAVRVPIADFMRGADFTDSEFAVALPFGKATMVPYVLQLSGKGYLYVNYIEMYGGYIGIGILHPRVDTFHTIINLMSEYMKSFHVIEDFDESAALSYECDDCSADYVEAVMERKFEIKELVYCFKEIGLCPECYKKSRLSFAAMSVM